MDRKEFIIAIWKKVLKPIILTYILVFCINFLLDALTFNGPERLIIILSVSLTIIIGIAYIVRTFLQKQLNKVFNKLPNKIKQTLNIIVKISDYIAPVILGVTLYHFYNQDQILEVSVILLVLGERINNIIKKEKLAITQG